MAALARRGRALHQLNLTQAQKDQLKSVRDQQRKDSQALRGRTRSARQALQQAMRADVPDEAAVKSAAAALSAVRADQLTLQARAKAQTMKVLTPEQQTQLKGLRARANRLARQRAMAARPQMMRRMNPLMGPAVPLGPGPIRRGRWII